MAASRAVLLAAVLSAPPLMATRGLAAAETRDQASKPNIVFILADDLGWADIGCFGSGFYETPNIDRLASRGMRFTSAYAACPVCSPTRASILSGKYPARLHLTDWIPGRRDRPDQSLRCPDFEQQLPLDEVTLAEALKMDGYATASIGKWHLGGPGFGPSEQGFELNIAGTESGSPPGYFPRNPEKGFDLPGLRAPVDPKDYLTDHLTTEAVKFIEQNKDHPFFLYFPHFAVHIPIQPRSDLLEKYQAKTIPKGPRDNPYYAAMVESLDESVGRVMKALEECKLLDRTLVVFMSDNGGLATQEGPHTPATSNAPLRAGKGHLYEGGIREPLIVVWRGVIEPNSRCDVPVSSVDFYPTLLELAGVPRPAGQLLEGVSLVPLLKQSGTIDRDALYWHYPHYSNQGGKPGGAIRQGDFKLIEFYEEDRVEFYNIRDDLGEHHDLAARMPERAGQLRRKLHDWLKAVDAQMPVRK